MDRARTIGRRALFAAFALWVVVTFTFGLVAFTGDPNQAVVEYAAALEAAEGGADAEEMRAEAERAVRAYREARNLDEPVTSRYVDWLGDVATGQLGNSYTHVRPVTTLLRERLAVTMAYAVPGVVGAVAVGLAVGTYAAVGRNRHATRLATAASYTTYGVPNFWIASVVLSVTTYQLHLSFVTGYDLERAVWAGHNLQRLALPTLLVGTGLIATQIRHTRTEIEDLSHEPFVALKHAKGLTRLQVAWRVLRVALLPLTTLTFSKLLETFVLSVFVVEFVLELPGFGLLTYDAVLNRDLPLVVGATLVVAGGGILGNFLQDVAATLLDPRVARDR